MADSAAAFSTFGALLRYLRRRQRMTQIDLAIATGYSTGQISRLEQDQRVPNVDAVQALFVAALGLEDEPDVVERLHELSQDAHQQRGLAVGDKEEGAGDEAASNGGEPRSATLEQAVANAPNRAVVPSPTAPLLITKVYVPRPRSQLVA